MRCNSEDPTESTATQVLYQTTQKKVLQLYNKAINSRATPTHLFDPHLVKTLQSAPLQATATHARPSSPLTKQAPDQATPRTEWRQLLWVAATDFRKTFDTVEHSSVWKSLREEGIVEPYTQLLTKLHDQQRASVHTDTKSKNFHLERGTKQGDPLSTLLFKSLLQYLMRPLTGKRKRDNHGVRLAEHDPDTNLSNLIFADDIFLISGSLDTITVLDDLTTATTAHGLQLHPRKQQ